MALVKAKAADEAKYRAPALEKGLDILEVLAVVRAPMTLSQISQRLDRSVNEIFRMIQVLVVRGYLAPSAGDDGYELTDKLFSLAIATRPAETLLSRAMPMMQVMSDRTFQACHLVVAAGDQMVVIARMEAPGNLSFSVRVGFRRPLVGATSGVILYAFQPPEIQANWRSRLQPTVSTDAWDSFMTRAGHAVSDGFTMAESDYTAGITDISCPIFAGTELVAALTIPYIRTRLSTTTGESLDHLRRTAAQLSESLAARPLPFWHG